MVAEFLDTNVVSFDIETTGLNPIDSRILLAQFGFPNGHQYILDISKSNYMKLAPFLESRKWTKIIHNAKFEQKFTQALWGVFINGVFDTMLAEQVINSDRYPKSLKDVALKYTNEELKKDEQKSFINMKPMEMFTKEQLAYAAKDVEILFPIYEAQKIALQSSGQEKIAQIEFDLAGVVAAMELEGVPVDTTKWRAKLAETKESRRKSHIKLLELFYNGDIYTDQEGMFEKELKPLNLGSPKQVAEALISLGIKLPKTEKGNWKTDERTLSTIGHPVTMEMLEYRGLDKILSTYGEELLSKIHPFTNRLHPDFGQIGTETGRFSCKDPNMQNIPEEFRECIGNFKDHLIVGADYANIELRIIAELSGDPALIKAFETGDDPHKSTAAFMFNIPIETVTKDQRFIAKTINFALTYGMGVPKLRDTLNEKKSAKEKLTFGKVYAIYEAYKETYAGVMAFFEQSGRNAFNKGESTTILGRKRYFDRPSGLGEEIFKIQAAAIRRQGGNAPIQGTNADITKIAMVNLHEDLREYGFRAKMIVQVHDEIVLLAHKNHAEAVKEVVKESMLKSAQEVLKKVPVKVDTYVSEIWKK